MPVLYCVWKHKTVAVQCSCHDSFCWWLKTMAEKNMWFLSCCTASVWRHFMPPDKTNPFSVQDCMATGLHAYPLWMLWVHQTLIRSWESTGTVLSYCLKELHVVDSGSNLFYSSAAHKWWALQAKGIKEHQNCCWLICTSIPAWWSKL